MKESTENKIFYYSIVLILAIGVIGSVYFQFSNALRKSIYIVTFVDDEESVLAKYEVEKGNSVIYRDKLPTKENNVFKGWNWNLNDVNENIEVHPIFQDISNDINVFYIDTYYAEKREDITVDLKLGGKITATNATIGIKYDSTMLKLEDIENNNFIKNQEQEKEYIKLDFEFSSEEKLETIIAKLHFKCKSVGNKKTDLIIDMIDVRNGENKADSTSINGTIYIY